MTNVRTDNVVNIKTFQLLRDCDKKFVGLLDRHIEEDPNFIEPMPLTVFERAASIEERLNQVRDRLFKEEM